MSDSAALSDTGMKDADLMSLKLTEFIIREFIISGSEARLTVEVNVPFNVSIFEALANSNDCREKI